MKIDSLDRPARLPVRIATALMREINEGRLKTGDRLPTEQFLADSFNVSRNVVREAIAQLRSAGAVHSRQGFGTVVGRSESEPLRVDMAAPDDPLLFHHVYELRAIIEMEGAAFAAVRGSDAQLEAIAATVARIREAERWEREGVTMDIEFHLAVARASGNPYIVESIGFLTGKMRETIIATRERSGGIVGEVRELTISEHEAVTDAILARAPDAARDAMAAHIRNAAARLGYDITALEGPAGGARSTADRKLGKSKRRGA